MSALKTAIKVIAALPLVIVLFVFMWPVMLVGWAYDFDTHNNFAYLQGVLAEIIYFLVVAFWLAPLVLK